MRAVVQHVVERIGHFPRGAQAAGKEAVVKGRAVAAQRQVDALGDRDPQPLHAAGQALQLIRLDDHVDVRSLYGKVDEAEAVLLATAAERLADLAPEALASQAAHVAARAPDDVKREGFAEGFTAVVGHVAPALAAGARPVT